MSRHWNSLLLGALLLGQLVLLSIQSRDSPVESLMLSAMSPIVHSARTASDGAHGFFDALRLAPSLRQENLRLLADIESMRRQLVRLHGVEAELERRASIADSPRFDFSHSYLADVVYIDRASWLRTLVVYTGSEVPKKNQPVVTSHGLVGRIIVPTRRYAKVLLLTDRSASVSAMIRRTRRRGLIRGGGETLILDNIPLLADVQDGDQILTAGIDGVFPRGIPIGEVTSVESGHGLFHRIEVAPAIDFGLLEQVYVLTEEVVPAEAREQLYGDPESAP